MSNLKALNLLLLLSKSETEVFSSSAVPNNLVISSDYTSISRTKSYTFQANENAKCSIHHSLILVLDSSTCHQYLAHIDYIQNQLDASG